MRISELRRRGVELVDYHRFWLQCHNCMEMWSPNGPPGNDRLPRGYWKCPNRCNERLGELEECDPEDEMQEGDEYEVEEIYAMQEDEEGLICRTY